MSDKAKYILRFDDICPTMKWEIWTEIETILLEKKINPILAVIPDNQDPLLMLDDPAPDFWDRVRSWQSRGWTIAMHGYQHKYVNSRKGMMGISPYSEFTGLPSEEQDDKLRRGMEILRQQGIDAAVFVAPAHSFDETTLKLLPEHGLRIISDGFARFPYRSRDGMFWIPQQLWKFTPKRSGVWTVCFHHNIWEKKDMEEFRRSVDRFQNELTCVEEVAKQYANRPLPWHDRLSVALPYVFRRAIGVLLRVIRP